MSPHEVRFKSDCQNISFCRSRYYSIVHRVVWLAAAMAGASAAKSRLDPFWVPGSMCWGEHCTLPSTTLYRALYRAVHRAPWTPRPAPCTLIHCTVHRAMHPSAVQCSAVQCSGLYVTITIYRTSSLDSFYIPRQNIVTCVALRGPGKLWNQTL